MMLATIFDIALPNMLHFSEGDFIILIIVLTIKNNKIKTVEIKTISATDMGIYPKRRFRGIVSAV